MALTMYQACVPPARQVLGALAGILAKAQAHAQARKLDEAVLLQARLFPDMFALARQVQLATDFAKSAAGRLAGVELPSFPDTETTFAALHDRLTRTGAFLDSLTPAQIDGSEGREIVLKIAGQPLHLTGQTYLLYFALPNLYFHAATAYDILRHNGVELGKRDFMGPLPA